MANILFHAFNLCHRGGTNSLRDYAHHNEKILGNKSTIVYHNPIAPGYQISYPDVIDSLSKRFEVISIAHDENLSRNMDSLASKYDAVYSLRSGHDESPKILSVPFMIHAAFSNYTDQCTRFAYVSKYLSNQVNVNSGKNIPYVPHILDLPQSDGNIRKSLNISEDQFVFGRIGGWSEFDVPFVHDALSRILSVRNDIAFIFVNTKPFIEHKNLFYLPSSFDQQFKSNFINSCDAMIHAREMGETFGLAMMEFLQFNKPVLAWEKGNDLNHVEVLQPFNLLYNSDNVIDKIYDLVDNRRSFDFSTVVAEYTPENVMKKFDEVFLDVIK